MSLQKLGDCGSRGASVVPRVGTVSESVAACACPPPPPDLAALECPRRAPHVPWRTVRVGIRPPSQASSQRDCRTQPYLTVASLSSGVASTLCHCCCWLYRLCALQCVCDWGCLAREMTGDLTPSKMGK